MERFVYLAFIAIVLAIVSPVQLIIGLLVAITSGLPVLYRQKRVGLHGRQFKMYKFRTMVVGAEKQQTKLKPLNEADGPVFKVRNDPRFTPIGRFLSHTGLDELPQLFNVLKREVSLIGPRPLPLEEEKKLKPWMKKRENIKPGIISPWILDGYHRQSFEQWMKSDIAYIKNKSLGYDMVLAARSLVFLIGLLRNELKTM